MTKITKIAARPRWNCSPPNEKDFHMLHPQSVVPSVLFTTVYIALNLAALRMKICCCHLCRAFGSGFVGGEIASTCTVRMSGLGGCKILSNKKVYGSFVS